MNLRFIAAQALRESRSSMRRLGIYMLAITLGVAALVSINSFRANVIRSIAQEARAILGADVRLSSTREYPPEIVQLIDSVATAGVPVSTVTQVVTMALAPNGATRLIQLRAVEGGYPFYGEFRTDPPGTWPPRGDVALVDPALLAHLGARIGDTLRIGEAHFVVGGTIGNLPAEATFQTAVGPRVFVAGERLDATRLLTFGSLVRYLTFLRMESANDAQRFIDRNHDLLRRNVVGFETAQSQAEDLAEALDALARFLGLVGLAALLLGGVGVASAVHVFIREKRATIAVLRCIGATQATAFTTYLLQAALLGIAGAVLGAAIGIAVQQVLPIAARDLLPVPVQAGVAWTTVLAGIGIGASVAILFALLPLLEIRNITPLRALRSPVEETRRRRFDLPSVVATVALVLLVVSLALWQAGDRRAGLAFAGGLLATIALLRAGAWLLTRVTRRVLPARAPFVVRQGVGGLFRPYNQTTAVTIALGFGVFLIAALWVVQRNLLDWIEVDAEGTQANLVLLDVQTDQRADVSAILTEFGAADTEFVPIVPARIARIGSDDVQQLLTGPRATNIEPWALRREYRNTYRAELTATESLVAGSWWDDATAAVPGDGAGRISMEQDLANRLGVGVGDRITWNFQGIEIETVVANLRAVDWARFETNFFVVFEPGVIDAAPQMHVALAHVADDSVRAALQSAIVRRHANVSAIDLANVQRTLAEIVAQAALAVRFMAAFSVVAGALVLAGAIAAARFQRVRESVLLRALGATRAQIRRILLTEYLVLGSLAAIAGALLGTVAAWGLVDRFFQLEFRTPIVDLLAIIAIVAAGAAALGMANSSEALRSTPLGALREAE